MVQVIIPAILTELFHKLCMYVHNEDCDSTYKYNSPVLLLQGHMSIHRGQEGNTGSHGIDQPDHHFVYIWTHMYNQICYHH